MSNARSRFFISLLAALTLVVSGCAFAFANSESDHSSASDGILYDDTISVGANFTTDEFVAANDHDINVSFQNSGAAKEQVTLQKKGALGKWSDLSSFSVSAGDKDNQDYSVSSGKTYRVVISSSTGDKISGQLRVKQTDGTSDSEAQANGVLYDHTIDGSPNLTSSDFTAANSGHINVYFENKGSEATNVTLQKHGFFGWSDVGSFSVPAGSQDYRACGGKSKATYRVLLSNTYGADVNGHLRVRQL